MISFRRIRCYEVELVILLLLLWAKYNFITWDLFGLFIELFNFRFDWEEQLHPCCQPF